MNSATPIPAAVVQGTDALLNDVEVSKLTGFTRRTLANWRSLGQGPAFVKLGKRAVRYPASAVQAFIAENMQDSATAAAPTGFDSALSAARPIL